MAARSAVSFVCVVRFATPQDRNTFYAASGQAGQGAEVQARKMLAALGICDVELVTWVQPWAKVANGANAAAGAGAAVKAEATTGSFSSLQQHSWCHRATGWQGRWAGAVARCRLRWTCFFSGACQAKGLQAARRLWRPSTVLFAGRSQRLQWDEGFVQHAVGQQLELSYL